jgi:5'-nucleotidase
MDTDDRAYGSPETAGGKSSDGRQSRDRSRIGGETEVWIVTNDDGIDAPGLTALREAIDGQVRRVVIAPRTVHSECGHALTTKRALTVEQRGGETYAVDGTPVDCVRLGLHHLAPDAKWVISGINAGGNLGVDVFHSGTVAAVREAAVHGLRGIAFSQVLDRSREPDWQRARVWARRLLAVLVEKDLPTGSFWNVNFPHLDGAEEDPEVVFCEVDVSPLPLRYLVSEEGASYSGVYRERARKAGGDVEVCLGGRIAVSRIDLP